MVARLWSFLDETNGSDPFQTGFSPGYRTEAALVALVDDLLQEMDKV